MLNISRMTLLRRVADGEIEPLPKPPALKRRARLEFRRADVERLAQPQKPGQRAQVEVTK